MMKAWIQPFLLEGGSEEIVEAVVLSACDLDDGNGMGDVGDRRLMKKTHSAGMAKVRSFELASNAGPEALADGGVKCIPLHMLIGKNTNVQLLVVSTNAGRYLLSLLGRKQWGRLASRTLSTISSSTHPSVVTSISYLGSLVKNRNFSVSLVLG